MLSAMAETGAEYDDVLKQAQRLGYAEAAPTEDVGGKDAAAKMAILASIGFHSRTGLDDVDYEGISGVTSADIAHGARLGLVAKLLGVAKLIDGRMNVRVYPAFIPRSHPLAGVTGAYNAVFLESDAFDKIMLFGPGAGSVPTASAVIGDIISVVNTVKGSFVQNCLCYKDVPFFADADMVSSFYLRLRVSDQPGVLAKIASLFGDHGVSIASMVQEGGGGGAELVLLLHPVREAQFFAALDADEGGLALHVGQHLHLVEGGEELSLAHGVQQEHELGAAAAALLHHRGDAHAVVAEEGCDLGQHAGLVAHPQAQVEAGHHVGVGEERHVLVAQAVLHEAALHGVDDRDDVADDRRGGGHAAGARAEEHDLVEGVALEEDGVVGARDPGQRVRPGDERRVHAHVHPAVDELGDAQQLGHEAEARAVGDIGGRHAADALVVHVVQARAAVETDRGEDRHLGSRVLAADVLGGVGLGVAEPLRFLEHVVVLGARLGHGAEHVVRGAVDDAEDRLDPGGHQRLAEDLDDGHGADGAGLEAEMHVGALRGREQLGAVLRQQLLVGGHHVLAGAQRAELEVERRADAADELHDDVDLGVLEDVFEARREQRRVEAWRGESRVLLEHALEIHLLAGREGDVLGVVGQQLADPGADGAVAEESDAYLVHCGALRSLGKLTASRPQRALQTQNVLPGLSRDDDARPLGP